MKSSPKAEVIYETALSIAYHANEVWQNYRYLHSAAYDRTVGDDVKVRSHAADPTGGLVASDHKRRARETLERANERMQDALSDIRTAEALLRKTLDRFDPPERPDPLRFPHTAFKADVEAAREAQARRKERGEDVPA